MADNARSEHQNIPLSGREQILNMSNEGFERRMALIVDQQAQFASDSRQLREVQAQTEQLGAQLADGLLEAKRWA